MMITFLSSLSFTSMVLGIHSSHTGTGLCCGPLTLLALEMGTVTSALCHNGLSHNPCFLASLSPYSKSGVKRAKYCRLHYSNL
jgi:hypothetical protein